MQIADNDYKADRTIKETVRCRSEIHCISNVKKPSNSTIGKPVLSITMIMNCRVEENKKAF